MGRIDLKIELPDDQMAKVKVVEVRIKKSLGSDKDEADEKKTQAEKCNLKNGVDSGFGGDF